MNKSLRNIIIVITVSVFALTNVSDAADSVSLSVSCSIPSIPGINAPLSEEETKNSETTKSMAEEKIIPVEKEEKSKEEGEPELIEVDSEEIALAEGGPFSVIVRTIYSR